MKKEHFLNKYNLSKPLVTLVFILVLFFFGILFNYFQGINSDKKQRGLASKDAKTGIRKDLEKVVLKSIVENNDSSENIVFSDEITSKKQFLFGLLGGNYKANYINKEIVSLVLKKEGTAFQVEDIKTFTSEFEKAFFIKGVTLLGKEVSSRGVSSNSNFFNFVLNGETLGRVEFFFKEDGKTLEKVRVTRGVF